MRDKKRIELFLKEIQKYWEQNPDLRFGQLLINVFGLSKKDVWFLEENETLKLFEEFFKKEN